MRLVVSTRNLHKLIEIRAILNVEGVELLGLDAFPGLPEVEEDGDTFEVNAVKKAVAAARALGMWALADDSGLEVDALGGAPGVYSARYAGESADYEANNRKLLRELAGVSNRRARFRCVMALADPRGRAWTVEGRCEGTISEAPRGRTGFGYDPLFVPDGYRETFAEMGAERKNAISHRASALVAARAAWAESLSVNKLAEIPLRATLPYK